jgi:WD40 repeat protein
MKYNIIYEIKYIVAGCGGDVPVKLWDVSHPFMHINYRTCLSDLSAAKKLPRCPKITGATIPIETRDGRCAASLNVAWSEANRNNIASCSGDGSIKLWDVSPPFKAHPRSHHLAHAREAERAVITAICNLSCNPTGKPA